MNYSKASVAIVMVFLMIAGASCTDPGSAPSISQAPNVFNPFSQDASADFDAWMSSSVTDNDWFVYTKTDRSQIDYQTLYDFRDCSAFFTTSSYGRVYPGAVRFDGQYLLAAEDTKFYSLYQGNQDFDMDGANYIWQIDSSAEFPAITDTIMSPSSRVTITSHAVYDSVSKSSNMVVTWSPYGVDDNVVVITLLSTDTTASSPVYYMDTVDDDGTHTIPASTFSGKNNQKLTLSVSRGKYKIGNMQGGRKYLMSMYSQRNVDLRLVN
ncbi:MAG: hypothetical protein RBU27_13010 [Bacteroidota bacterium]|jgi:hypothetical protein|nr:hypothetical protein [Bacteroidota bacterium]